APCSEQHLASAPRGGRGSATGGPPTAQSPTQATPGRLWQPSAGEAGARHPLRGAQPASAPAPAPLPDSIPSSSSARSSQRAQETSRRPSKAKRPPRRLPSRKGGYQTASSTGMRWYGIASRGAQKGSQSAVPRRVGAGPGGTSA
ncbi:unnamed protein product, partial [Prorocentrum cordatum]